MKKFIFRKLKDAIKYYKCYQTSINNKNILSFTAQLMKATHVQKLNILYNSLYKNSNQFNIMTILKKLN